MNAAGPARPRPRTASRTRIQLWLLLIACLGTGLPARAQVFELQGGTSSLFDAHGGTLVMYGENYTARASIGYFDHFREGFSFLTQIHGFTVDAGDQTIPFSLPTDLFNHSYYFLGRGASVEKKYGHDRLFLYGGVTSTGYFAPYLNVASAESFAGLAFYEHEIAPTLHFYSFNIVSNRQTSIQALSWAPRKNLEFAVAGGVGSNQPYGAVSADYHNSWLSVLAGYVTAGHAFQRIRVDNPLLSETDKENVRVELSPRTWLHVSYDREHYVSPDLKGLFPRAGVNGYSASVNGLGFVVHGELYDSHTDAGNSRAVAAGVRRNFWNWLDLSEDYFHSTLEKGQKSQALVSTVRERVSRRIALAQYISTGNGQTTISYGGSFFSNRFSFGVDYQTIYLPLAVGLPSQFKQVIVANVRLLLPHSVEVNGMTDVDPTGRVRYTGYFSAFAYRGLGASVPGMPAIGPGMYAYVVRGRVVDDHGEPVRGAAVRVQGEIAFTNSEGEFLVRRRHADECTFDIALGEFMVPGTYEVVSAPSKLKASREETAQVAEVVIRRLKTPLKKSEAREEAVHGVLEPEKKAENSAPSGKNELPVDLHRLTPAPIYADKKMEAKVPYNPPGGGGNAGAQITTTDVLRLGVPQCGDARRGAARVASGERATGCATAADGWRVVDSTGPEPRGAGSGIGHGVGSAKRDRGCFGLAKQVGACEGPHRKARVQSGSAARSTGGAHRAGGRGPSSVKPCPVQPAAAPTSDEAHSSPRIPPAKGPAHRK